MSGRRGLRHRWGVCKGTCGGTLIGAPCTSSTECSNGTQCLSIGFAGILACASVPTKEGGLCDGNQGTCVSGTCTTREKTFGQTCDGDDFFISGDPNQRFCGDDPSHRFNLVCCAGSGLARSGQEGTCRECCNDDNEDNGGCPQNEIGSMQCCGGNCKDVGSDPHNCGSCGNDCFFDICPSGTCPDEDCVFGRVSGLPRSRLLRAGPERVPRLNAEEA